MWQRRRLRDARHARSRARRWSATGHTPSKALKAIHSQSSVSGRRLAAFTELLSNLPDDTGMAFVLIQHLDPKHESHLTELLSKAGKMPVTEGSAVSDFEARVLE